VRVWQKAKRFYSQFCQEFQIEETSKLIEAGFEFVYEYQGIMDLSQT